MRPRGFPAPAWVQPGLDERVVVHLPLRVLKFIKTWLLPAQVSELVKQGEIPPSPKPRLVRSSPVFQPLFHLPLAELYEPTAAGTDSPRHGSYFYQFGGNGADVAA